MKRSAAKTPRRQRKPPVIYVDEYLGRSIAFKLLERGHDARPFDEFAGKPDIELLPAIGERGWVFLLEIEAILNANLKAFVIRPLT